MWSDFRRLDWLYYNLFCVDFTVLGSNASAQIIFEEQFAHGWIDTFCNCLYPHYHDKGRVMVLLLIYLFDLKMLFLPPKKQI